MGWLGEWIREVRWRLTDPSNYHSAIGLLLLAGLVWSLGSNAISLGEDLHVKLSSDQVVAAVERAKQEAQDDLDLLKASARPQSWQIRYAEVQVDKLDKMCRRVKSGEKLILRGHGKAKVKKILTDYFKGKALGHAPEESQWLMSAYDKSKTIGDAYMGVKKPVDKDLEALMVALDEAMGTARARSGDELDQAIAGIEVKFIVKQLEKDRPHLKRDDPRYMNALKKAVKKYHETEGTPLRIKKWIDSIVAQEYGDVIYLEGSLDMPTEFRDEFKDAPKDPFKDPRLKELIDLDAGVSLEMPKDRGRCEGEFKYNCEIKDKFFALIFEALGEGLGDVFGPLFGGGEGEDEGEPAQPIAPADIQVPPELKGCRAVMRHVGKMVGKYNDLTGELSGTMTVRVTVQFRSPGKGGMAEAEDVEQELNDIRWSGTYDRQSRKGKISITSYDEACEQCTTLFPLNFTVSLGTGE